MAMYYSAKNTIFTSADDLSSKTASYFISSKTHFEDPTDTKDIGDLKQEIITASSPIINSWLPS
jgi:hypothetical protein